ncbi:hypothetical protein PO124_15750 [Bacillus licheniformis]|nr:hypothetical protein [Bacillus licheniformis]
MAFVQTPQAFYNEDPYQYNLFPERTFRMSRTFHAQAPGWERPFNAVMYVGSNTVFRRTALEEIGGLRQV